MVWMPLPSVLRRLKYPSMDDDSIDPKQIYSAKQLYRLSKKSKARTLADSVNKVERKQAKIMYTKEDILRKYPELVVCR